MGCFLGCFGLPTKRKRRKSVLGGLRRGQNLGSYEPLDSSCANLDIKEEAVISQSEFSKKPKETLKSKIRKKVTFDLNVQTYEPIPREESENLFWENEGREEEKSSKEGAKDCRSYPPNYRYGNCIDDYDDEDDEIASEECEFDDDDEEEEEDEYYYDCDESIDVLRKSQEGFSGQFSSEKSDSSTHLIDARTKSLTPLGDSNEGGMNQNSRDGTRCVLSVLKPVENLRQWKAVKAKGLAQVKQQRKENAEPMQQLEVQKPLLESQEIAMNASLSNWVVLSGACQSNIEPITKSSNVEVERSYSWRNRDDMPNLDISSL